MAKAISMKEIMQRVKVKRGLRIIISALVSGQKPGKEIQEKCRENLKLEPGDELEYQEEEGN